MEGKERKERKNRCVKCNSTFGYLRIKTNQWQCRTCGNLENISEEIEEEIIDG